MPESYRIESDPDWDAEAEEEAADREPIARIRGRNLKWWIIAAAFTLAMALFATSKIMGVAAEQVTAETFGFKVIDDRTATITFDVMPKPNQTTKSGTSATFGTTCVATMKGLSVSSSQRMRAISTPRTTPMSAAQKNPTSVA